MTELDVAVDKHSKGNINLSPGDLVDGWTVKDVTTHTVTFTKGQESVAVQIPFVDSNGNMTAAGARAQLESKKRSSRSSRARKIMREHMLQAMKESTVSTDVRLPSGAEITVYAGRNILPGQHGYSDYTVYFEIPGDEDDVCFVPGNISSESEMMQVYSRTVQELKTHGADALLRAARNEPAVQYAMSNREY